MRLRWGRRLLCKSSLDFGGEIGLMCCRIESMKMETVIRSPQKGVVAKLAHKEGVSTHTESTEIMILTWKRIFAKLELCWFYLLR